MSSIDDKPKMDQLASGDAVKSAGDSIGTHDRSQLNQFAEDIVDQAISEAESEISVQQHRYQSCAGAASLKDGGRTEKDEEEDKDKSSGGERSTPDANDERLEASSERSEEQAHLRRGRSPFLAQDDDYYVDDAARAYSTSPSRLDASDLMQDLTEISNCASRIDTLLDTPAASVSARLRRSMSPLSGQEQTAEKVSDWLNSDQDENSDVD